MTNTDDKINLLKDKQHVEFWHTSHSVGFLDSFINEGCKPMGKGEGGQKAGFYVFDSYNQAVRRVKTSTDAKYGRSEIAGLKIMPIENDEGLIVGLKVDKKDIKYPDWQFDYECSPKEMTELVYGHVNKGDEFKVKHEKNAKEDSPLFISVKGEQPWEKGSKIIKMSRKRPLSGGSDSGIIEFYSGGIDAQDAYILQQINDHLCKTNPDYLAEYNQRLQDSLSDNKSDALKYCGEKPLKPHKIIQFKANPNDGSLLEENVVYSAGDKQPEKPTLNIADIVASRKQNS